MIAAFAISLLGMVLWQAITPPDIAGKWKGEEWGTVVVEEKHSGNYEGTYTHVGGNGAPFPDRSGTIQVKWSRLERRFNGVWKEADDRSGQISLRLVDDEIRGGWTTNKKSDANSGMPRLADLVWKRDGDDIANDGTTVVADDGKLHVVDDTCYAAVRLPNTVTNPNHWRWKVHIPKDGHCELRFSAYDVPVDGIAKGEFAGSEDRSQGQPITTHGEVVIEFAAFPNATGDWQYGVSVDGSTLFSGDFNTFRPETKRDTSLSVGKATKAWSDGVHPVLLLAKYTGADVQRLGSVRPDSCHGFAVWIRDLKIPGNEGVVIGSKPDCVFLAGISQQGNTGTAWFTERGGKGMTKVPIGKVPKVGDVSAVVERMEERAVLLKVNGKLLRWKLGMNFADLLRQKEALEKEQDITPAPKSVPDPQIDNPSDEPTSEQDDRQALIVVDSADYGDTEFLMRMVELERNAKTSKLRMTYKKRSPAVGSRMFMMWGLYEVAKARGTEYFICLDGSSDRQNESVFIAGFTNNKDADIQETFGELYSLTEMDGQKRKYWSVSEWEFFSRSVSWSPPNDDSEAKTEIAAIRLAVEEQGTPSQKHAVLTEAFVKSDSPHVKMRILQMAKVVKAPEFEPFLLSVLQDKTDVRDRILAVLALAEHGSAASIEPLLDCAENDPEGEAGAGCMRCRTTARRDAYLALAEIGLRHPAERDRIAAAVAAIPVTTNDVRDPKAQALYILTQDQKLLKPFLDRLRDEDPETRALGVRALRPLKLSHAPDQLVRALADSNSGVQAEAARILGEIGDSKTIPVLIEAATATDRDTRVRSNAVYSLGQMRAKQAEPALRELLTDQSVKVIAAIALSQITGERRPSVPEGSNKADVPEAKESAGETTPVDEDNADIQVSYLWKTFTVTGAREVIAIIAGIDGQYLVAGNTYSEQDGSGHWWGELSAEGRPIRETRNWDIPGVIEVRANALRQTSDGSVWVVGGDCLSKFTDQGKLLFSNSLYKVSTPERFSLEVSAALETNDDGLILAGNTRKTKDASDAWIMRIDKDGRKVWEKSFSYGEDVWITSGVRSGEDEYVFAALSGQYDMFGAGFTRVRVIQCTSQGAKTGDCSFDGSISPASMPSVAVRPGRVVLAYSKTPFPQRDASLVCLDSQLKKIWEKELARPEVTAFTPTVSASSEGTFVVTWNGMKDFRVWGVNENGQNLFERAFENARGFYVPEKSSPGRVFVQKMDSETAAVSEPEETHTRIQTEIAVDLLNDGLGNPKGTKSLLLAHAAPPMMISGETADAETAVRAAFRHIQFEVVPEEKAKAVDAYMKSLRPTPSPYLVGGALSDSQICDLAEFVLSLSNVPADGGLPVDATKETLPPKSADNPLGLDKGLFSVQMAEPPKELAVEKKTLPTLKVRVLDEDGEPITGASVLLYDRNHYMAAMPVRFKQVSKRTTDANGVLATRYPAQGDLTSFEITHESGRAAVAVKDLPKPTTVVEDGKRKDIIREEVRLSSDGAIQAVLLPGEFKYGKQSLTVHVANDSSGTQFLAPGDYPHEILVDGVAYRAARYSIGWYAIKPRPIAPRSRDHGSVLSLPKCSANSEEVKPIQLSGSVFSRPDVWVNYENRMPLQLTPDKHTVHAVFYVLDPKTGRRGRRVLSNAIEIGADGRAVDIDRKRPVADFRDVRIRMLGGEARKPLTGLELTVFSGGTESSTATTQQDGDASFRLPYGYHRVSLTSPKDLPYLPFSTDSLYWSGDSRSIRVTEAPGEQAIELVLADPCELVLRAIDVDTGEGIPGVEFALESTYEEAWADRIVNETIRPPSKDRSNRLDNADDKSRVTDKDGYFRRQVGPRHDEWTYCVSHWPDTYRPMESGGGKGKIDTSLGRKRAEYTFLFYRQGDDATKVSIAGHVLAIDGRPAAAGYRVTALPEAWSGQSGRMPSTVTDRQGTFVFRDLPDGPCNISVTRATDSNAPSPPPAQQDGGGEGRVRGGKSSSAARATSDPLTQQPNMRIENVTLKKGEPAYVRLSLQQK